MYQFSDTLLAHLGAVCELQASTWGYPYHSLACLKFHVFFKTCWVTLDFLFNLLITIQIEFVLFLLISTLFDIGFRYLRLEIIGVLGVFFVSNTYS